ncbi:MAG: LTA synthase family protein, partial [Acetobacteraceae bacterium]|nr:LTA synthase family protein [Acetobacteraceae bacterium]MDW8399058.1 LTA synthase family protein [Acetobacteraceae bacterium]
ALARDQALDSARIGPATTLLAHAAIARAERRRRQAEAAPADPPPPLPDPAPHLVLLQLESFWDARGRTPRADAPALPGWDALAAQALVRGRLAVPGFGANTMRAEFAALTGLPEAALGLDAPNPYAAFARRPVGSLAHRLAAAGYATLALHPHDPRFFGRDRVLPALGFRRFEAEEAFRGAPREGRYVADAALGEAIAARLAESAGPAFLFAISIAAHGPWDAADPFADWAARIARTDSMLARLAGAARALPRPVVLLAWGDHLPSLPETAALPDWRTDWLAWHSARPGRGALRDIAAADIPAEALAALSA